MSDTEAEAILELRWIAEYDLAESIVALPWLADGVSDTEVDTILSLREIARRSTAELAESVIALPWLADEVSDSERSAISLLFNIAAKSATTAKSVIALPWLADGVSDAEAGYLGNLYRITRSSVAVAESVLALPWLADGVSDTKRSAVAYLSRMNADEAARVVDMPFLQTLEAADVAALRSLRSLTADQLADMLSRPMLKDGITDDEAPIVSMLYQTLKHAPDRVDRLLDPGRNTVERRTVDLPLAGEVDLVIVRTYLGVKRSMDLLENAVREAENLMGEPFPTRYVWLLFENAFNPLVTGSHFGTIMALSPEYDAGEGAPLSIAHETAHYYWIWNTFWIDEGMAELMKLAVENRRVGTPITPIDFTNNLCKFAQNLKELEDLATEPGEDAFICNYSLGRGLFVHLLRALGEDAFWEGARRLYAALPGAGIEEVRQAFPEASILIKRRYEGR